MLPARSTRYAGLDGEISRLQLVSNVQLALIAFIMLAMFWLLFSPQSLVRQLYAHDHYDDLTWSYLQNLYHSDPHNADVAILVARAQQETSTIDTLETQLSEILNSRDQRQRDEVRLILLKAYQRDLHSDISAQRKSALRARMRGLVNAASTEHITDNRMARALANAALAVGQIKQGIHFLQQADPDLEMADLLLKFGMQARDSGEFETSANCFFAARGIAPNVEKARRWFQFGINSLMANSLFARAMEAAEQEIGDLRNDPQTLRYLVRQARAAGYPDLAAKYAWELVAQRRAGAPS